MRTIERIEGDLIINVMFIFCVLRRFDVIDSCGGKERAVRGKI